MSPRPTKYLITKHRISNLKMFDFLPILIVFCFSANSLRASELMCHAKSDECSQKIYIAKIFNGIDFHGKMVSKATGNVVHHLVSVDFFLVKYNGRAQT